MKTTPSISVSPIARSIGALGLIGAFNLYVPAHADELSDLKAALKRIQDRVEQLEKEQAKSAAAPANSSAAVFTPGTVQGKPSGLEWKLYGRGDIGYTRSTGKIGGAEVTTNRLNQGEMTSRLGLTGAWVFNADYRAIFAMETGINLFDGNAGGGTGNGIGGSASVLLNRGATAGIATANYGSIEAGLMYMAPFWVALGADQASAHNYGANDFSGLWSATHPNALGKYLVDPPRNNANASNTASLGGAHSGTAQFYGKAVRYRTPKINGFSAELSYTNGQQASGINDLKNDGRAIAGNIIYSQGPWWAGYAHMDYTQVADVSRAAAAATTNTTGVAGANVTIATAATPATAIDWQTRRQVTDIVGLRYKWSNFTLGGSYTAFRASNAGGYAANAFGLSGGYDIGKHTLEASIGRSNYKNASAAGAYGNNRAGAGSDPRSTSYGLGYIYSLEPNLSLYLYHMQVKNNATATLGVTQFRSDNNTPGATAHETTAGMFFVF